MKGMKLSAENSVLKRRHGSMKNAVMENDLYYCTHFGVMDQDEQDIWSFSVKHSDAAAGLTYYLQNRAFSNEISGLMRTYVVREQETDEFVAYFSLKAGLVSTEEHKLSDQETIFDTLPGVELAFFAVNEQYAKGRRGIGAMVFEDFVEPIVREASKQIGIYLIYIFALPEKALIENYHRNYGFMRLSREAETDLHARLRPRVDRDCIFMYKLIRNE